MDLREKVTNWIFDHWILFFIVWIILVAVTVAARPINKVTNIRTIEGTVTDKTTKKTGKTEKYLVFIDDGSGKVVPLEVTDALLRLRFDSSDVWGNIEIGKTYAFEVGGSRWALLSWYPNIYKAIEKTE